MISKEFNFRIFFYKKSHQLGFEFREFSGCGAWSDNHSTSHSTLDLVFCLPRNTTSPSQQSDNEDDRHALIRRRSYRTLKLVLPLHLRQPTAHIYISFVHPTRPRATGIPLLHNSPVHKTSTLHSLKPPHSFTSTSSIAHHGELPEAGEGRRRFVNPIDAHPESPDARQSLRDIC